MGRLSDQNRSARRPGKRERKRRNNNRAQVWFNVPSGEVLHVKYGRKHALRVDRKVDALRHPSIGEPEKSESKAEG